MGLDTSYLEDMSKNKNNENSIYTQGKNLFYSILLFVLFAPLLYMYNKITLVLLLAHHGIIYYIKYYLFLIFMVIYIVFIQKIFFIF